MSEYPTQHPDSEPTSFTQAGADDFWWTYNPDAELGEGHGIGYFEGKWVVWRDIPEEPGNRWLQVLPLNDVPDWAFSRQNQLL